MTGDELRQWRTRMTWNQGQAAREMGLSRRQVNRLENRTEPVPAHVERLALLLEERRECVGEAKQASN